MQTSLSRQHCRTLTCIVFSNTHARDFDALECMPATTKGTVPCQTHAPGTPTGSGARPPTSRCAPSSSRRAGARHAMIEFIEAHWIHKRPLDDRLQGAGRGYDDFPRTHGAQARRASHGHLIPRARVSEILTQVSLPCRESVGPNRSNAKHALDVLIACGVVGQKPGEKCLRVMVD